MNCNNSNQPFGCIRTCNTICITGITGATGATGITGATGPTGPAGLGAIIPASSGNPITLTTTQLNTDGVPAFIGFGASAPGKDVISPTIDITTLPNMAFSVPRSGTITSFTAYFSLSDTINLTNAIATIGARIYRSITPNNNFVQIAESVLDLTPNISGIVPQGTIVTGSLNNLNIPILANERLLIVFTSRASGASFNNNILGYASAGIGIS